MATPPAPPPTDRRRPRWRRRLAWLLLAAGGVAAGVYGPTVSREAGLAAAYGALIGCSCHFVAGRPLGGCR
ncbi:hypothetical protein ABTN30_20350, partial [Acinetobacter baumannii]